ncbi:hypothetical protein C1H46_006805 [Malus baccata]|uniref:Uncharacterized protein n=1 Tax=Malus baccata TaxID=106549 RepID=A0A540N8Y8_MALBA|nr:hypothetical protein C1H46_006805 [Malus baccata]
MGRMWDVFLLVLSVMWVHVLLDLVISRLTDALVRWMFIEVLRLLAKTIARTRFIDSGRSNNRGHGFPVLGSTGPHK